MLFTLANISSKPFCLMTIQTSFTYRNEIFGEFTQSVIALVSKECMSKLPTIGGSGEPIATPFCL